MNELYLDIVNRCISIQIIVNIIAIILLLISLVIIFLKAVDANESSVYTIVVTVIIIFICIILESTFEIKKLNTVTNEYKYYNTISDDRIFELMDMEK